VTQFHDRYGLQVTTSDGDAAQAYVAGLDRLISYDGGAEQRLRHAIELDPEFALAHAALAVLRWQQRRNDEATTLVDRAQELASSLSRREQQHVAVAVAAIEGHGHIDESGHQVPSAHLLRLAREHLEEFPRDALVLLLLTLETIFSGDPDEKRGIAALYERLAPAYAEDWWFPGWRASCEVELDHLQVARRLVNVALAADPRNPIAAHAVGHVHYEAATAEEGADFLSGWLGGYDREGQYHSHISWHYSLLDLIGGQPERALETYRRDVDPGASPPMRTTLADSANFLWGFHLAYPDLSGELSWASAREHALDVAQPRGAPLRDLLIATVLLGAGDTKKFEALRGDWQALLPDEPAAGRLVLPVLDALRAFSARQYEQAATLLEPVVPELYRIGGSNQQRDMFEDTLIEARRRIEDVTAGRPTTGRRPSPRALAHARRRAAAASQPDMQRGALT
jgi:hypothetical protein